MNTPTIDECIAEITRYNVAFSPVCMEILRILLAVKGAREYNAQTGAYPKPYPRTCDGCEGERPKVGSKEFCGVRMASGESCSDCHREEEG